MREQLQSVEGKQRRRRYSFERPVHTAARETLRQTLEDAGLDSSDAPKPLLEEGEALIRPADQLLASVGAPQTNDATADARGLSDTIVADRPKLFAHRRTKQVDTEQLIKLAALGCTNGEIGMFFGLDASTISRRFAGSLQKGRALRKRLLRQRQTEVALDGNVGMLIWLGKQELGQRNNVEGSGIDAGPKSIAFFDGILAEKRRRKL